MASSSSILRARSKASARTTRVGAVAAWLRAHRGDLIKDGIIGLLVGVVLFLGACWWDTKLQARQDTLSNTVANRQDDLAKSIADSQDRLARDLANQAELLENTRFVRQVAMSGGWRWKPFAHMNLGGAQLGGLNLQCVNWRTLIGCANFLGADLHEANFTLTTLRGAGLIHADLHNATLDEADLTNATLSEANLTGVTGKAFVRFRGARMDGAILFQARLADNDFRDTFFVEANADEAVLFLANFHHADLERTRFRRADLWHANFRGANMTGVDLTSADLRGADFTRADLRKAVLTDVCFDTTTNWGANTPPASSSC